MVVDCLYTKFQKSSLAILGGVNARKAFTAIFKATFPSAVLSKFSWKGTTEKRPWNELKNIRSTVTATVKINHEKTSLSDYDVFVKSYLRQAPFKRQ